MVCIYCGYDTTVANSRVQKLSNNVWRRRKCRSCGAIFTSIEKPHYPANIVIFSEDGSLTPFLPEKLFLSVYGCLRHRQNPIEDAKNICDTITRKIFANGVADGKVKKAELRNIIKVTLNRFDKTAMVHYQAFHAK